MFPYEFSEAGQAFQDVRAFEALASAPLARLGSSVRSKSLLEHASRPLGARNHYSSLIRRPVRSTSLLEHGFEASVWRPHMCCGRFQGRATKPTEQAGSMLHEAWVREQRVFKRMTADPNRKFAMTAG